jgi:hypothetical protein
MLKSGSQSFQLFSGGMSRLVGRNREKYFIPVDMLLGRENSAYRYTSLTVAEKQATRYEEIN